MVKGRGKPDLQAETGLLVGSRACALWSPCKITAALDNNDTQRGGPAVACEGLITRG
jgi:hypothetical protein